MANNTLEYILKLKDEASKTLESFSKQTTITSKNLQDFAKVSTIAMGATVAGVTGLVVASQKLGTMGGKLLDVENSFDTLASNAGFSSQRLMSEFQETTDKTISNASLMQNSVKASMLGIPIDKMSELMGIARTQAVTMGEDMTYMLDSIVTGVGRASPLILDNLGISIKMGEVYENAAVALGKSSTAMTDAEKKTALLNAVIEWGNKKQEELGGSIDSNATSFQQLSARITNVKDNLVKKLVPVFETIIFSLQPVIDKIDEFVDSEKFDTLVTNIGLVATSFSNLGESTADLISVLGGEGGGVSFLLKTVGTSALGLSFIIDSVVVGFALMALKAQEFLITFQALVGGMSFETAREEMRQLDTKFNETMTNYAQRSYDTQEAVQLLWEEHKDEVLMSVETTKQSVNNEMTEMKETSSAEIEALKNNSEASFETMKTEVSSSAELMSQNFSEDVQNMSVSAETLDTEIEKKTTHIGGMFGLMARTINKALKSIEFPHITIDEGTKSIMGTDIKWPKINVDWYEKGGWVGKTGLAVVHEGEFVMSKDMLNGNKSTPQSVSNNYNSGQSVVVNATINNEMGAIDLGNILGQQLAFAGR